MALDYTPGLEDLLDAHFSSRLEAVRGPMPGVVMAYNPATQEAKVALLFDVDSTTGVAITLEDVPVQFPGYAGRTLTFPLLPGDPVLCVPAEADISGWRLTGDATKASTSRFDISDVVAFPTLRTKLGPLGPGDVDPVATVVSGSLVKLGASTATDFVALASLVLTELGKIKAAYDVHTHNGFAPVPVLPTELIPPLTLPASTSTMAT